MLTKYDWKREREKKLCLFSWIEKKIQRRRGINWLERKREIFLTKSQTQNMI